MLAKLAEVLFGCSHHNYSFPISFKPGYRWQRGTRGGTYVVCLDCGRELAYDWSRMRVVAGRAPQACASGRAPLEGAAMEHSLG